MFKLRSFIILAGTVLLALPSLATAESRLSREEAERRASDSEVQQLYFASDVGGLERLANEWRSTLARTSSGAVKLAIFYDVFYGFEVPATLSSYPDGSNWRLVKKWAADFPQSPTPHIILALMNIAQSQKGDVWSPVKESTTERIFDFLEAAKEELDNAALLTVKDPHWFVAQALLQRLMKASDEDVLLTHAEVLRSFPTYEPAHQQVFTLLRERWYPNSKLIHGFANTILDQIKGDEGQVQYARLFDTVAQESPVETLEVEELLNWKNAKAGFEQIIKRYPTEWNKQRLALYACVEHDRATAAPLIRETEKAKNIVHSIWRMPFIYKSCLQWALKS